MIDRKKVIKALEHCKDNQYVNDCNECDYGGKTGTFCIRMIDDVLALLKEQDVKERPTTVEVVSVTKENGSVNLFAFRKTKDAIKCFCYWKEKGATVTCGEVDIQ